VLRIKFRAGRKFSASKSASSPSAKPLSVSVESQPHIQAHLVFADTQSPNKKPKELEFCQLTTKIN